MGNELSRMGDGASSDAAVFVVNQHKREMKSDASKRSPKSDQVQYQSEATINNCRRSSAPTADAEICGRSATVLVLSRIATVLVLSRVAVAWGEGGQMGCSC